ncbi:MAG TPA: hypothetical protein VKW04_08340 [Planctomycetota bacterium]|nr:hypothetical protein [Planctomycetota bacterium]
MPTAALSLLLLLVQDPSADHPLQTWVKRTPIESTPPSPRLGYEGDCVWDPRHRLILRYGGHNQGGGGEQHSELWTCDPFSGTWTLHEPNLSPPGVCCAQQNLDDPVQGRYLRFPAFSGSHGWQWQREIYLNQSSVWSYDLDTNLWRNQRPFPTVPLSPLRCASWDEEQEVAVLFGGEGSSAGTLVYDPHTNTWTEMKPARQPAFRSGGNMAYHAARKIHLLFGSQFGDEPATWAYDLRRNEWTDLQPSASPPTKENDAVLKYDAASRSVVAIVKKTEGKDEQAVHELQTWAYDAEANVWKRLNPGREPDRTGNRCRVLMAAPDLNLLFLENCPSKPREEQIWSYRVAAGAPPSPRTRVRVRTEREAATLAWTALEAPVTLLRASGARPWEAEFEEIAQIRAGVGQYRDGGLRPGTVYHYKLSTPSFRARTQPRAPEDVVVSVTGVEDVSVSWPASPEADVVGYVVEEADAEVLSDDQLVRLKGRTPPLEKPAVGMITSVGPFRRIPGATKMTGLKVKPGAGEGSPIYRKAPGKDEVDPLGVPYAWKVHLYRVRAVNALGVESGPSAAVLTIPSPVQNLFSQEDGGRCRLRWQANPEQALRGYRVYRIDGRYDKEPVTRLTPDPIVDTTFVDGQAGKKSRRYYVVAVDALGQEGSPSSPVWYEREWKSFYQPFTGPWHQ